MSAPGLTTRWNGEPAECRRVSIVVARGPHPTPWYLPTIGTRRKAVEVTYGSTVFYLEDGEGEGWRKVTEGHGGPAWTHRNLYAEPGSVEVSDA